MARTTRIVTVGAGATGADEADVVVARPPEAPSLARALAARPGARRARLVVDGDLDATALGGGNVARIEADGPVGGLPIQRALQLGAQIVVVPRMVPGAAAQGGAAWYHAWKPTQLAEWAGGLLAGRALPAAVSSPAWAEVDRDGSWIAGPTERARVVGELLVGTPFDGHASPEVEARLEAIWVQGAGANRVRGWGAVGVPSEAATPAARIRIGGAVHDVPPVARPPGRRVIDDALLGSEITMSFQVPETGEQRAVELGRLVHAAARDHGGRAVLAVWTRDPTHWEWLEDLAREERIQAWIGRECRFTRLTLPKLSAVRVLLPGTAAGLAERVLAERVEVDEALVTDDGT